MYKILVTGGAGFIGSNLCEALARDGENQITVLDDYSTGKLENHIEGVDYVSGSTVDVEKLISFNPDIVYHLGEYSRVEQSFQDLDLLIKSNIHGTYQILNFCLARNCKLLYAGSSTKFGSEGNGRNQSPYAWSKASNVDLVKNFGSWYGLKFAITYFYNVYGHREISEGKYATLIGIYKEKIRQGLPLPVVNPGTQRRFFTHIEDLVNGLILVGKYGSGDGYGIGSSENYSVLEIANMFGGKIEMLPSREGNRMNGELHVEKTKELNWRAENSIVDYIDSIVKSHTPAK